MEGIYTKAWKSAQHAGSGFGTFSVEGQIVNIFSIAGQTIPVARDQLCHCSFKAARGSTQMHPCICVPIKLCLRNGCRARLGPALGAQQNRAGGGFITAPPPPSP